MAAPLLTFLLTACLVAADSPTSQPGDEWVKTEFAQIALVPMAAAPFPHPSRADGFTARDGTMFRAAHYADATVAVVIPEGFVPGEETDFIVHFHGHRNNVRNVLLQFDLARQLRKSRVNAILVIPQGPSDVPDSGFGKLEEAGGLDNLLQEVARFLHSAGKTPGDRIGRIVLTAHSGGYKPAGACVARGGVTDRISDVLLFDATYGGLESFAEYASQPDRRLVSIFTDHLAGENYMLLASLRKRQIAAELLMDKDFTTDQLSTRRPIFIYTTDLGHNDVVSKRDYFALFLQTSGLRRR